MQNNKYTSMFNDKHIEAIQEFVKYGKKYKSLMEEKSDNDTFFVQALRNFVAEEMDRPKLWELANRATLNEQSTYNFQIHCTPSTSY